MDFPNAQNRQEAYLQWKRVLQVVRDLDPTTTIHSLDRKQLITQKNSLPDKSNSIEYTDLTANQKRYNQAETYACVTTVATARPIHEMKRLHPRLLQTLQQHNVYLRSTNFSTTDTSEIGFLIGLHPSMTNIEWRTQQLTKALGHIDQVPRFQLYRRKLQEDDTTTSVIVIRCAKSDVQDLQTALMTAKKDALGTGVEFIPYHLVSVWWKADYLAVFHQQNQYIHDTGAVAIQGIDPSVMEEEINGATFQDFLLSQEDVLSIEKSNMPNTGKWWILTPKNRMENV